MLGSLGLKEIIPRRLFRSAFYYFIRSHAAVVITSKPSTVPVSRDWFKPLSVVLAILLPIESSTTCWQVFISSYPEVIVFWYDFNFLLLSC